MRKISAHFIITGTGEILKNGIVVLDDAGTIVELVDTGGVMKEMAGVEFYSGLIVSGFVNTHCHLELSHLHNLFPEKRGLPNFLKHVLMHRDSDEEVIVEAERKGDNEMYKNGIVAVGDISNNEFSFEIKRDSKLYYHTFIEALGFLPQRAEVAFKRAENLRLLAEEKDLSASIVPHAPYSISDRLFKRISSDAEERGAVLTMHNQESNEEDKLFIGKVGKIAEHLINNIGLDISFFRPSGKSSLESVVNMLPAANNLILVHNVYTGQKAIDSIINSRVEGKTWMAICPGSNLYIDSKLPDIDLFRKNGLNICLGTDSLASNHKLSILEEIKILQNNFPDIPLEELICWGTINGAEALGIDDIYGSIEPGKRPGLNLISGMDLQKFKFLPGTRVKRII
jgi:cytosine/adenosine deaminase-related metal-dependent hydrolase